jgi:hypothetical protein
VKTIRIRWTGADPDTGDEFPVVGEFEADDNQLALIVGYIENNLEIEVEWS